MASSESGPSSSNQSTESKGFVASVFGGVASTGQVAVQGLSGTVSRLFGYNKTQEETFTKDPSRGDMAQQTGHTGAKPPGRFSTTEAGDGFLDVDVKDDDSALGQAIKENEKLHSMHGNNLRKIAELERRLKSKDAELQALKEQASGKLISGRLQKVESVDNTEVKKDAKIRFLERQLEHAKTYEERVAQLTIEVTQKDEEISQLKKASASGSGNSQVQVPQSVQGLTAELEKWRGHSKAQSRQVLALRQELDAIKLEAQDKQSFEGLLEVAEREKSSLFQQLKAMRAERDELKMSQQQLVREFQVMKQQEMETTQKSQLLEAQMDDPDAKCSKRACTELRKLYNTVNTENTKLRQNISSLSRVSDELTASEKRVCEQNREMEDLNRQIEDLQNQVAIAQTQAELNKADFEQERKDRTKAHGKFADLETEAAEAKSEYKKLIANLQKDLITTKKELKSHQEAMAHLEKYSKKKAEEAAAEKKKLKTKAEGMIKELMKENERLKAQLSQAANSMVAVSEEIKSDKKARKKIGEEISKGVKKFKSVLSAKQSKEAMEREMRETENLIDKLTKTIDERDNEIRQLQKANEEMSKILTAGPKAMKKFSYKENEQPTSLSEDPSFSLDMDIERSEKHTAGLGLNILPGDYKQPSLTESPRYPSTIATREDQFYPLPQAAGTLPVLGEQFKSDFRRSSDPALSVQKFPSSSAQGNQAPSRGLQPPPPMVRFHSTPGPQSSSSDPSRASVPPSSAANPLQDLTSQQSALTRPPLRAGGVPPPTVHVSNQSGSDYPTPPGVKIPPKMRSAELLQQHQDIPVVPRPVHSQPQQVQQQIRNEKNFVPSNAHPHQANMTPRSTYPQGTTGGGQQLQTPQGRPHVHSDYQEYTSGGQDATHQPEISHTPHSHPIQSPAGQHHSGGGKKPAALPRSTTPRGISSQIKVPASELYNPADLQPGGNAALKQQQPPNKQSADYVNFEVVEEMAQESRQKAQDTSSANPPALPPKTTRAPQASQKPAASQPSPIPAESLPQGSDKLATDIDDDIEDTAAEVREQVSSGRERLMTDTKRPFDPNLVCPMCSKGFRIGEIQKFRRHVNQCEGKKDTPGRRAVRPQGSQDQYDDDQGSLV